jgi:hypothetical protein
LTQGRKVDIHVPPVEDNENSCYYSLHICWFANSPSGFSGPLHDPSSQSSSLLSMRCISPWNTPHSSSK